MSIYMYAAKFNYRSMNLYSRILSTIIFTLANLLISTIMVLASAKNITLSIDSNENNYYNILVKNAEDLAKKTINQEFDNNPEITSFTITILGERKGQIVPVIRSTVSRAEWQNNPNIDNFTRYFADAKLLLKFEDESDISEGQPQLPNPSPQIPAPPPPLPNSQPKTPQPQNKSPRQRPSSTSPRFPTDEDDPRIIDD